MCRWCDGRMRSFYETEAGDVELEVCIDGEGQLRLDWAVPCDGSWNEEIAIAFCPFCGRKLTVE